MKGGGGGGGGGEKGRTGSPSPSINFFSRNNQLKQYNNTNSDSSRKITT